MIKTFKDKEAENIFNEQAPKKYSSIYRIIKRKLDMLHFAYSELILMVSPANYFEHLKGNLSDYCSIRINDQFRIVFIFQNGCAYDVQIMDYHK